MKNSFLTPKEQKINNLAFYAEFIWLLDFDDWWKNILYKQFLDYLINLDLKEFEWLSIKNEEVIEQENSMKNHIKVILEAENINDKNIDDKILEITIKLQHIFSLSPVKQIVNFGQIDNSSIPVELEEKEKWDIWYNREVLQKQLVEILKVQDNLELINQKISLLQNTDIDKNIITTLKDQRKTLENIILELEKELEKLRNSIYLTTETKATTKTKKINPTQAEFISNLPKNTNTNNSLVEELKKVTDLSNRMKWLQKWFNSLEQRLTQIVENVWKANLNFNLEDLEAQSTWILEDFILDENNYFKYWNINWKTVQKVNWKIEWLKLEQTDIIFDIKIINIGNNLHYLEIYFIEWNEDIFKIYYIKNWKYNILDLDWKKEFEDYKDLKFDDNWNLLAWAVKLNNWNWKIFYTKNWIHISLDLDWKTEFKDYEYLKFDESWKFLAWAIELGNWNYKIFYTKNWNLISLDLDWENEVINYDNLQYDNNWKFLAWAIIWKKWNWKILYSNNWNLIPLSFNSDWMHYNSFFCNILKYDKNWKPLAIVFKFWYWVYRIFYTENWKLVFLDLDWINEFQYYKDLEFDDNWKLLAWVIKLAFSNDRIFYTENWKLVFLNLDWINEFQDYKDLEFDDNWLFISWEIKTEKKLLTFFKEYKELWNYIIKKAEDWYYKVEIKK